MHTPHTRIHIHAHTHTHRCARIHIRTSHTRAHTHTTHMCIHTHTPTLTPHACAHTLAYTHTSHHTHKYTCTHTPPTHTPHAHTLRLLHSSSDQGGSYTPEATLPAEPGKLLTKLAHTPPHSVWLDASTQSCGYGCLRYQTEKWA